jgi:hypothetical protein
MPLLLEIQDSSRDDRKVEKRLYDFYDGFVLGMDRCCGPGAFGSKTLCLRWLDYLYPMLRFTKRGGKYACH